MKRSQAGWILLLISLACGRLSQAQSSLDMLQKELDDFKEEHQETASKNLDYFFSALQSAEDSAPAAEKLYLEAGGKPPERARVITQYEHETPTEESARKALDQATMASFDASLQLHCGMMRFAALFATQPKKADLPAQWLAWLKTAAQNYPQVTVSIKDSRHGASGLGEDGDHPAGRAGKTDDAGAPIRAMTMSESVIADYLGFHAWGKEDSAKWSVAQLPKFYHDQVLDPLRATPGAETQGAWDTYIAMMNADQPDEQTWSEVDYPALQFEKACDDFAAAPATEKLQNLVGLIKAHPNHPKVDDWIKKTHDLIQGFQAQRAGGGAPAASTSPNLPPVAPDGPTAPAVSQPVNPGAPSR